MVDLTFYSEGRVHTQLLDQPVDRRTRQFRADWSSRRNCLAHPTSHRQPAPGTRAKTHAERLR
jgi:hypothetical protein